MEIHGLDRGSFILRSAFAVGAVYGTAAVSPFVTKALAEMQAVLDAVKPFIAA